MPHCQYPEHAAPQSVVAPVAAATARPATVAAAQPVTVMPTAIPADGGVDTMPNATAMPNAMPTAMPIVPPVVVTPAAAPLPRYQELHPEKVTGNDVDKLEREQFARDEQSAIEFGFGMGLLAVEAYREMVAALAHQQVLPPPDYHHCCARISLPFPSRLGALPSALAAQPTARRALPSRRQPSHRATLVAPPITRKPLADGGAAATGGRRRAGRPAAAQCGAVGRVRRFGDRRAGEHDAHMMHRCCLPRSSFVAAPFTYLPHLPCAGHQAADHTADCTAGRAAGRAADSAADSAADGLEQ